MLQIDAILGRPIAVVGPSGSYYTGLLRPDQGPTLLVSATNFATECVAPETLVTPPPATPTTPAVPETPATPIAPTGEATTPPASVPESPTTPAAPTGVLAETVSRPTSLPTTGASGTPWMAGTAAALVAAGAALVTQARRLARREA
jgi:LPXTG-motif cell wall-anchored protein